MTRSSFAIVSTIALAALIVATPAADAAYPTNSCVSGKQKAASKYCASALKAWSKYQKDPTKDAGGVARDADIADAATDLGEAWIKLEAKAAKKSAGCAETTVTSGEALTVLDDAVAAVVADLTASVDNEDSGDRKCRSSLLKNASKLCGALLKTDSKFIKDPSKDVDRVKRTASRDKATDGYGEKFTKATDKSAACEAAVASSTAGDTLGTLREDFYTATTTSPNLSNDFTHIQFEVGDRVEYLGRRWTPICSQRTPYSYWVRKGTSNNVLMYYQGGGACWSDVTCNGVGTMKKTAGAGDNPELVGLGFAKFDEPTNPFLDWTVVFVSYCTGDVHWGDNFSDYNIWHHGRHNAAVAEQWAREHVLDPDTVVAAGSSAGSYGAIYNAGILMLNVWPQAQFNVIGDAGVGVITQEWIDQSFENWNAQANIPKGIEAFKGDITELSAVDLWLEVANHFPQHRFAQYQSAYDGTSGGQSGFFNIMANLPPPATVIAEWTNWWNLTCEWNACMRLFNQTIQDEILGDNYRYYIGAGSRHTIWGSDKIYKDTAGGVPTFLSWVNEMFDHSDTVGWDSVECTDCNNIATCQGGDNFGDPCSDDGDCPGGFCQADPEPGSTPNGPYTGGGVVDCDPAPTCDCDEVVCGPAGP